MAEVWMARREAMGGASKTVAIKLLASHLASKTTYRRMFVDEARLTMMLTHSNIVQVFDIGEHAGRSYLVMEWIDGIDLARLAASMREVGAAFEFHVVAHVIGELLRALAYAHGLNDSDERSFIVHRDISPHNVLLSVSGEVKLSDFGVARLASEESSGVHVRGKLRYMPPEQVRGHSKHATTDLFAVGAVMQELLDGVRFRAGLERDELFGMVIRGEVPPLRRANVPRELMALRDALLASDRDARVQSAGAALELLRRWPGYRNAADELTTLVRERAGVAAPRSGLTVEISDEQLESSDEPASHASNPPRDDASELATRTVRSTDAAGSETAPHTLVPPTRTRSRRLPAVVGVAVASLGMALGFGYAWLHEPASSSAAQIEVAAIEPVTPPSPELHPSPSPAPASAAEPEPDLVLVDAVEPAPQAAKPSPRTTTKAGPPAQVEFAAHEFFFVWIKVGGRTHALEPTAKITLPPGRHKVSLRERADQPWTTAGHLQVAAGRQYKVSLRKPHGLTVQGVD
jgi:eukaryotic-like serine/threonine-protein kinase